MSSFLSFYTYAHVSLVLCMCVCLRAACVRLCDDVHVYVFACAEHSAEAC